MSAEIEVGPVKIKAELKANRLECHAYVFGIHVNTYYLERTGGRVIGKFPGGGGHVDAEMWWEGKNLHLKVRTCTSNIVIVCTPWAEGSVAIPGA